MNSKGYNLRKGGKEGYTWVIRQKVKSSKSKQSSEICFANWANPFHIHLQSALFCIRYVLKWIHAMKHFYCLIWIWNWILIDLAFGRNGFGIWYEREEVVLTKLNGKSKENTCVEKIENWGRLLNYNCQISRLGEKDCKVSKKLGKSWGEKADWTLFGLVSFSTQQ